MGVFDYVRCKASLPDGAPSGLYQTKDTSCMMNTYTITEDGRVVDGFGDLVPFRGDLRFYSGTPGGQWWAFSALVDDGRVLSIRQISPDPSEAP